MSLISSAFVAIDRRNEKMCMHRTRFDFDNGSFIFLLFRIFMGSGQHRLPYTKKNVISYWEFFNFKIAFFSAPHILQNAGYYWRFEEYNDKTYNCQLQ